VRFSGHVSDGGGNIGIICQPKEADGEVSERGHHSGAGLGSYLRAILIKGDVPDIMAFVFDAPMSTVKVEELLGRSLLGRETGDEIGSFSAFFARFEIFGMTFYAGNLSTERKIQIRIQIDRCPDFSHFQAAVRFFTGFMLRGEMPRLIRGKRCLLSGWIDYP
jgi:hypothetical protein